MFALTEELKSQTFVLPVQTYYVRPAQILISLIAVNVWKMLLKLVTLVLVTLGSFLLIMVFTSNVNHALKDAQLAQVRQHAINVFHPPLAFHPKMLVPAKMGTLKLEKMNVLNVPQNARNVLMKLTTVLIAIQLVILCW